MSGERVVLRDVRVFDGHRLSEPRAVVIDGPVRGRCDRADDRSFDATGATLLPALIDAYVPRPDNH